MDPKCRAFFQKQIQDALKITILYVSNLVVGFGSLIASVDSFP